VLGAINFYGVVWCNISWVRIKNSKLRVHRRCKFGALNFRAGRIRSGDLL
jgi:hypothetical protein